MYSMRTLRYGLLLLFLPLCLLNGCSNALHSRPPPQQPGYRMFSSERYDIKLRYPADLELRHTFQGSTLAAAGWRTYMGPDAPPGRPLVALVIPASNEVTTGELRIGVSRNPAAVKTCLQLPDAARPASRGRVMIDGVPFTTFKAADAGMSHYLIVKSYRGLHEGTCYALDVLVFGTNPNVYDPPATPPFSKHKAFERLVPLALNVQFIEPAESP